MSCWVVPSIAAELWGIPVEAVMQLAAKGEIASTTEHQFFLVQADTSIKVAGQSHPETYTPANSVSAAQTDDESEPDPEVAATEPSDESKAIEDWREVRRRMARLRVPPGPRPSPN